MTWSVDRLKENIEVIKKLQMNRGEKRTAHRVNIDTGHFRNVTVNAGIVRVSKRQSIQKYIIDPIGDDWSLQNHTNYPVPISAYLSSLALTVSEMDMNRVGLSLHLSWRICPPYLMTILSRNSGHSLSLKRGLSSLPGQIRGVQVRGNQETKPLTSATRR